MKSVSSLAVFLFVTSAVHGGLKLDRSAVHRPENESSNGTQAPLGVSKNGSTENPLAKGPVEQRTPTKDIETPEEEESSLEASVEPREEDYIEAADYGMQAMRDLYHVKEPKLYSMGVFLSSDNPARYVAAFNEQSEEARQLAKFGYAVLEAAKMFRSKFPDVLRQATPFQSSQNSILEQQCPRRGTPQCPPASQRYRTSDGSCNNQKELWWGSAMSTMQRFLPPVYEDGIESIRKSVTGAQLPSARDISDYVHVESNAPLISVTHMLMQWGQFIDHDMTATGQSRAFNGSVPQCCVNGGAGFQPADLMHPDCLPIGVHQQDKHLGRLGVRCLEFVRSGPAPREDCQFGAREQLSQVTSYIDASTVYSSSARQSDGLRIFRNGLMQYGKLESRRPVLPRQDSDVCQRGSLSTTCFRAGDARLVEQPALISLHVLFLRLHNRLATRLSALNQHWGDEKIFQETRRIVGAIVQHITYREFLPIVLGPQVMKIFELELLRQGYYEGYDQSANPNIANAFAAAAFRFGHSLVQPSFVRFDGNHQPLFNNVSIHEEFSNPANLETAGSVDRILLGLVNQPAQKRDEFISEELTNHLFQTPGFPFGMDLASLNIQRGRDHGVAPYADWRVACSLSPVRSWSDLNRVMSPEAARKFQDLYDAVEDIDLFSAGLAEKSVAGGLVGPTFACIIAQQFKNLRKGDRFWYENSSPESAFSHHQLEQIRRVSLAQILCLTMDSIENVQPFVMLAPDDRRNQRLDCQDPILAQINLDPWKERGRRHQRQSSDFNEQPSHDDNERVEETESRSAQKKPNQRIPQKQQQQQQQQKPTRTRINQQNRIIIRRPLGPHENLTIVVNNNAVNSPVFISDSVYGSSFHINQYPQFRPPNAEQHQQSNPYPQEPTRPLAQQPYFPFNFADPNNPNPPNYGFNANPLHHYPPNDQSLNHFKPPNYGSDYKPLNHYSPNDQSLNNPKPPNYASDYRPLNHYSLNEKPIEQSLPLRPTYSSLNIPLPEQDDTDKNQQDFHFPTSSPTLSYRPTVKPPYHQSDSFSSHSEISYNANRPSNSYSSTNHANNPYSTAKPFHHQQGFTTESEPPYNHKPQGNGFSTLGYNDKFTTKKPLYAQSDDNYQNNDKPLGTGYSSLSHTNNKLTTIKPLYTQSDDNFSSNSETTYHQNDNRPSGNNNVDYPLSNYSNDPYINFQPNHSDRDKFNPNPSYGSRPVKNPKQPSYGNLNRQFNKNKPVYIEETDSGHVEQNTYLSPNEKPNQDQHSYIPQNLHDSYDKVSHLVAEEPQTHYSASDKKKESNLNEMAHYLHRHTTISNIQYVPTDKLHIQNLEADQEVPSPLTIESRESGKNEVENLNVLQNSTIEEKNNSTINSEISKEKIEIQVNNETKLNNKSNQKVEQATFNRTNNDTLNFTSINLTNSSNEHKFFSVNVNNELPKPIELKRRN